MPDPGEKLILIIEDDQDIRVSLAELLESESYRVTAIANGREALERLVRDPLPDLILLDLMLPEMSGGEFIARKQELRAEVRRIPVVLCSADSSLESKAKAMGADGFIRKPLDIDPLLDVIRQKLA